MRPKSNTPVRKGKGNSGAAADASAAASMAAIHQQTLMVGGSPSAGPVAHVGPAGLPPGMGVGQPSRGPTGGPSRGLIGVSSGGPSGGPPDRSPDGSPGGSPYGSPGGSPSGSPGGSLGGPHGGPFNGVPRGPPRRVVVKTHGRTSQKRGGTRTTTAPAAVPQAPSGSVALAPTSFPASLPTLATLPAPSPVSIPVSPSISGPGSPQAEDMEAEDQLPLTLEQQQAAWVWKQEIDAFAAQQAHNLTAQQAQQQAQLYMQEQQRMYDQATGCALQNLGPAFADWSRQKLVTMAEAAARDAAAAAAVATAAADAAAAEVLKNQQLADQRKQQQFEDELLAKEREVAETARLHEEEKQKLAAAAAALLVMEQQQEKEKKAHEEQEAEVERKQQAEREDMDKKVAEAAVRERDRVAAEAASDREKRSNLASLSPPSPVSWANAYNVPTGPSIGHGILAPWEQDGCGLDGALGATASPGASALVYSASRGWSGERMPQRSGEDGERRAPGRDQEVARAGAASDRGSSTGGEVQGGRTGGSSSRALGGPDRVGSRTGPGSASLGRLPSGGSQRPTETPALAPVDDGRQSRERSPQHDGQGAWTLDIALTAEAGWPGRLLLMASPGEVLQEVGQNSNIKVFLRMPAVDFFVSVVERGGATLLIGKVIVGRDVLLVGPRHVLFECNDERHSAAASAGDDPGRLWMFVVDDTDDACDVRDKLAAASETD